MNRTSPQARRTFRTLIVHRLRGFSPKVCLARSAVICLRITKRPMGAGNRRSRLPDRRSDSTECVLSLASARAFRLAACAFASRMLPVIKEVAERRPAAEPSGATVFPPRLGLRPEAASPFSRRSAGGVQIPPPRTEFALGACAPGGRPEGAPRLGQGSDESKREQVDHVEYWAGRSASRASNTIRWPSCDVFRTRARRPF